jgi:hypothetical protein
MLYGQIAESSTINDFIYRCFQDFSNEHQAKFVKKFKEQPHDRNQVMHTLSELICGAYLSSQGYRISYDYIINGRTPDWCILNDADSPVVVIELVNFHIDEVTENDLERQKLTKGYAVYRRDENANTKDRLYESLKRKATSYRELVNTLDLPYVIAVRPDYRAFIDLEEVRDCLISRDHGLFESYPHLSGVIYLMENGGRYSFHYIASSSCLRATTLPEGFYP